MPEIMIGILFMVMAMPQTQFMVMMMS
uniref:Uncharacterized protein MANES_09G150500 n=1 Tax=Rhizophora mucronata TaxID=61149 RepID=A0A2P2J8N8_RHIMU